MLIWCFHGSDTSELFNISYCGEYTCTSTRKIASVQAKTKVTFSGERVLSSINWKSSNERAQTFDVYFFLLLYYWCVRPLLIHSGSLLFKWSDGGSEYFLQYETMHQIYYDEIDWMDILRALGLPPQIRDVCTTVSNRAPSKLSHVDISSMKTISCVNPSGCSKESSLLITTLYCYKCSNNTRFIISPIVTSVMSFTLFWPRSQIC